MSCQDRLKKKKKRNEKLLDEEDENNHDWIPLNTFQHLCQIQRARSVAIHRNVPACSFLPQHICISPFGNSGDCNTRLQSPGLLSSSTAHSQPKACWISSSKCCYTRTRDMTTAGPSHADESHRKGQESEPGCRAGKDQPHSSTNKPKLNCSHYSAT